MDKNKKAILVTGAKGQVGQEFQLLSKKYLNLDFTFVDLAELDITDMDAVRLFFEKNNFNYCINCAAYTAVDKAENHPDLAEKVNVKGVEYLAENCNKNKVHLFHLSTDYVYHSGKNQPFNEGDKPSPKGVYGKTKLAGDEVALRNNVNTTIIRTSWVYSTFGNNFVKTMIRLGTERDELKIIFDQIGTPTYARDIAKAIMNLIEKTENQDVNKGKLNGIFHFSNEGVASWYDFAKAIFEIKNIDCKIYPIETKDYPTPASRPHFSLLNKAKIKTVFGIEIPYWRDSLQACLREMS
ncbi:MAG: dTDP-4-dehydrorhamnose reductase [Bacteroidota bacterium]